MPEKLSERVKKHFGTLRFRDDYVEMAQRIEALEALGEAVEPEDTSTLDERTIVKLAYELAEAKAEIKRLRANRDGLLDTIRGVQLQRDEAKAEIERLRKEYGAANATIGRLRYKWAQAVQELADAKGELASYTESVNADAEIGRLVRGMQSGSRLIRVGPVEEVAEWWVGTGSIAAHGIADDPAEALRAIQEVGDGL